MAVLGASRAAISKRSIGRRVYRRQDRCLNRTGSDLTTR
jgi:hypothetical protein